VAGGGEGFALDEIQPLRPEHALHGVRELAFFETNRGGPGVFRGDETAGKQNPAHDVERRHGAFCGALDHFVIARVEGGAACAIDDFDFNHLLDAHLFECRCIGFVEALEFDGGQFGEGELAGVVVAVNAAVERFDFFEVAQEAALGCRVVAGEGGVAFVLIFGPAMRVAGEAVFDFVEAVLIALELPVGESEVFNQRKGGGIAGRVVAEPVLDGGFEGGGIFVG
jgi:hypothetical protein